jgi:hypothetical protein
LLVKKWKENNNCAKMIQYFNWLPQLEALPYVDSIENELVIFQY